MVNLVYYAEWSVELLQNFSWYEFFLLFILRSIVRKLFIYFLYHSFLDRVDGFFLISVFFLRFLGKFAFFQWFYMQELTRQMVSFNISIWRWFCLFHIGDLYRELVVEKVCSVEASIVDGLLSLRCLFFLEFSEKFFFNGFMCKSLLVSWRVFRYSCFSIWRWFSLFYINNFYRALVTKKVLPWQSLTLDGLSLTFILFKVVGGRVFQVPFFNISALRYSRLILFHVPRNSTKRSFLTATALI